VSDSKKRDVSLLKTGTAKKEGPMSRKSEDGKMSKMTKDVDSSKNVSMAESSQNGTIGQSEKSSTTFRGDSLKNVENPFLKKPIRAPTPTPEKRPEVHRTSNDRQENPFPVPRLGETGEVSKMRHLGSMSHCDTKTRKNLLPTDHDSDSRHVTERHPNQ